MIHSSNMRNKHNFFNIEGRNKKEQKHFIRVRTGQYGVQVEGVIACGGPSGGQKQERVGFKCMARGE